MVPLLFEHTVYKSYPASPLLRNRFDLINGWLEMLTTHDLKRVDVRDCKSTDEWIDRMNSKTESWLHHSSGTTGTFRSFLNRGARYQLTANNIRSGFSILAIRDLQMQCPRLMSSFPHAAPPRRQRPLRIGSVKHATQYIQPGLELMSMDPKIGAEVFEDDARLDDVAVRLAADIGANNQELFQLTNRVHRPRYRCTRLRALGRIRPFAIWGDAG